MPTNTIRAKKAAIMSQSRVDKITVACFYAMIEFCAVQSPKVAEAFLKTDVKNLLTTKQGFLGYFVWTKSL